MYLDVGFGYKLAVNEIYALLPINILSVKNLALEKRKEGKMIRATKGRKGRSLLLLKNGMVCVSAYTTDEIVNNIHELNIVNRHNGEVNNE